MKRTKLAEYVAIIKVLAKNGPMKSEEIASASRFAQARIQEELDFLVQQEAIKKLASKKTVTYAASSKGLKILKFFNIEPSVEASPGKVYG